MVHFTGLLENARHPVAGPCRGTLLLDPCKNGLPARIGGWPGTATGGQIHVVHISHTHPPKEIIQALRKYLLGKNTSSKWYSTQNTRRGRKKTGKRETNCLEVARRTTLSHRFFQNSGIVRLFSVEKLRNFKKFRNFKFQHFQRYSDIGEIPIKFHQNLSKDHRKEFNNDDVFQNVADK